MVSVLIPVYGESIDAQLATLAVEIKGLDYRVEVIVCDDHSPNPKRPHFTDYPNMDFRFIRLGTNIGRSRIRNYLASEAKYDQLIFIDADCQPILGTFIRNYVLNFTKDTVLVGGQLFSVDPPQSKNCMLRWVYGTKVESRTLKNRLKEPYKSFMANNFSISRELLHKYPFDDTHTGYGHEDTLFGIQLRDNGLKVVHIKNPVRHLGADTNGDFLLKTAEGARNLARLYVEGKLDNHVKLIKTYRRIKQAGFARITRSILARRRDAYYRALLDGTPNLRKFSLYKLVEFMLELERLKDDKH